MKNNYNLILMRHAAYQDVDRILTNHGGSKSGHLTPFGIIQSLLAARFLVNLNQYYDGFPKVTDIFTSTRDRAIETGHVMDSVLQVSCIQEPFYVFYKEIDPAMKYLSYVNYSYSDKPLALCIVHEPFLEKLFGERGKGIQHTAGFIVDSKNPVESAIAFKTAFDYDAYAINNKFRSTIFGRDVLGQDITFGDVMQRALNSHTIQEIINNYRQMHHFATRADMDKFTQAFPRNNIEMNRKSLVASRHFECPVIGAPFMETQKEKKVNERETLPDAAGRVFLDLFLKNGFNAHGKTSVELESILNEFRYRGK